MKTGTIGAKKEPETSASEADELLLALYNVGALGARHPSHNATMAQARVDAKRYLRSRGLIES